MENRFKLARTTYNQHGQQTVKEVSEITGVTGSLIDDLESTAGKRRDVGYSKIVKLAKHYGVTSDYLLGLSNTPSVKEDIQNACKHTGLSERSVALLHEENKHNPMFWRIDMVNFLLEHPVFPALLDFLIGVSISKGQNLKDVPVSNGTIPAVTDRDIFKVNITELMSRIAEDSIGFFEDRPDYRWLYELYYGIFFSNKFKTSNYTLDDVRKEMEANGLIFNEKMFQDTERDGK